jgi:23S rRNA (cytosine1962-C5)-methyltransferase
MSPKWEGAVDRALARRKAFLLRADREGTDAMRLFSGQREGIPGLIVDKCADVAFVYAHEGRCPVKADELKGLGEKYVASGLVETVYLKRLATERFRAQADDKVKSAIPLAGRPSPAEIQAREYGVRYLVRPYDGFMVGLFPDQRENRRFLAERSQGMRVLNLFAYTCAFSVATALQGAEVTSVDLSKKYLEWGKQNFELNGLDPKEHRFVVRDAVEFLSKSLKREETYDLVIVDPPSFSRDHKGKPFSVAKDFKRLFLLAVSVLEPENGRIFFSTNLSSWNSRLLRHRIESLREHTGVLEWTKLPTTGEDFRLDEHPLACAYLKLKETI